MFARQTLRLATSAPRALSASRALHASPARLAPGLAAKGGNQEVGEDAADTQRKNAAVPVFMAAGVAIAGYIVWSQISAGKAAREEKKDAKTNQEKENPPAGSKDRTGMRG
ncbi:hypothetical protein JCM10450v2_005971 [Rhodotorula kratochvilovae]